MIRFLTILIAVATVCWAESPDPIVKSSAEWREASAGIRDQFAKLGGNTTFVDAAYLDRGGFATVSSYVISEKHTRDDFDALIAGMLHAAKKKGFRTISEKTALDKPFPRRGVLLEGTAANGPVRLLIFYTFSGNIAYVFTLVGDGKLDFESEMVHRYSQRVAFASPGMLDANGPESEISRAWKQGNQMGEALIVVALLFLISVAVYLWRRRNAGPQPIL